MTTTEPNADSLKTETTLCTARKMPRRREQRRQARERVILDAAQELMQTHGYDAMTMDDLAARAGITKPTLYQHFPSKEKIAVRAVVERMRCACEFLAEQDTVVPAITRLDRFLRCMVEARFSPGHMPIGPTTQMALTPILRAHPDYQVEFESLVAAVSDVIEQAKAEGTFRRHLPTRAAVQMMFSVLRDGDFERMIESGTISFPELADAVVAILLNGMCTSEATH
jgi:AcrR family transcriptional regulator